MKYGILWSPSAKEEYAELLSYVEAIFGLEAALTLLDKTDMIIEAIATFPESFPASPSRPTIRKAVITKQTSLLYRIEGDQVELIHFWDNRRE